MYAKHSNLVDVDATGTKASAKHYGGVPIVPDRPCWGKPEHKL